jgi:exosome complex component CSL4
MASDLCLPGQPIPIPRGPVPNVGTGTYAREGQIRASLAGVPRYEGSVGLPFYASSTDRRK